MRRWEQDTEDTFLVTRCHGCIRNLVGAVYLHRCFDLKVYEADDQLGLEVDWDGVWHLDVLNWTWRRRKDTRMLEISIII